MVEPKVSRLHEPTEFRATEDYAIPPGYNLGCS